MCSSVIIYRMVTLYHLTLSVSMIDFANNKNKKDVMPCSKSNLQFNIRQLIQLFPFYVNDFWFVYVCVLCTWCVNLQVSKRLNPRVRVVDLSACLLINTVHFRDIYTGLCAQSSVLPKLLLGLKGKFGIFQSRPFFPCIGQFPINWSSTELEHCSQQRQNVL